jgi:predicted O-methyltransferase YrrM
MISTTSRKRPWGALHGLYRCRNSIAKRLFWRQHLAEAIDQLTFCKRELTTPEMLLAVPLLFRGRGFYDSLDLMQNMDELRGLVKSLQEIELKNVCEIGTFRGGTLFVWCQIAAEDANIFSIDLPGGEFGGGYHERCLPFFGSFRKERQALHCLRGDSHSPLVRDQFSEKLGHRRLDFLFIDGDHRYAGVKQDYEDYSPFVRSGGVIAFHDIVRRADEPTVEVWRFWNEIKQQHRHAEFVETGRERRRIGLGLIYKDQQS